MLKKIGISFLVLCLSLSAAKAQLAKQEGVTLEQIGRELGELAEKKDPESQKRLAFEAKALAESKNESFVNVAVKIFAYMGDQKESERINASIVKRFPKGVKARTEAFNSVFNSDKVKPANEIEKQYQAWLKKFPENAELNEEQPIYTQALAAMAFAYYNEKNDVKAYRFLQEAELRNNFAQYANWLGSKLLAGENYQAAKVVLAKGYEVSAKAIQSTDPKIRNSNDAKSFLILAQNYSKTLEVLGDNESLAEVLAYFIKTPHAATTINALKLGQAYLAQGKRLDAFLALDSYLRMPTIQGKDDKVIELLSPLYKELNGENADFDTYIAGIRANVDNVLTAKFQHEMVKKTAPLFTVTDMQGKQVSLADLKGKVVILEFWATWCSPCKRSLPGMQALVNKYKNDHEVEFLFVNVFQKEDNFKELVEKYVSENNYSFHVVFDKMKDYDHSVAKAYAVQGIPHKVVIDKQGFIRFEGTGDLADPEKTVNELSVKIELARKG